MRLAELCDSSTGYIGEIEAGKRFPSVSMIERIAEALGIESYFLFKNEPIASSNASLAVKLAPSQKKALMDRIRSTLAKTLEEF
jgi:transcriptional regulator with XRE-family HTH domain